MNRKTTCAVFLAMAFPAAALADNLEQGDLYLPGVNPQSLHSASAYTVLDVAQYHRIFFDTRKKIQSLISALPNGSTKDEQVAFIAQQLADIPYLSSGAMGEGDWQPNSMTYQPGAVHIKQDPVYRLDGLDCQTFVQVGMGLLNSKNVSEFDQAMLKISYGATGNLAVHYYNRNNFTDGDWNPVNQSNGFLFDATANGDLASFAATTSVDITRQNWFLFQQKNLASTVRVLNEVDGAAMASRFMQTYSMLNFPKFEMENVSIAYLPKEKLALKQTDGTYLPNQALLDKIPTPSVIEIVRDAKKWTIGEKNIKDVIGSELSISHMGLLYRQSFNRGEVIHQRITCNYDADQKKICTVAPVLCQKEQCNELMFAHATDARPNGYFWYQQDDGNFACTSTLPTKNTRHTTCNRIEQKPLFDYLTDYQYGAYWYMDRPSIVGIHIEKLM